MWRGLAIVLAACSFRPTAVPSDATSGAPDASHGDAPATFAPCSVHASGAATAAGVLGGNGGGSPQPDLACAAGELPIGFAFDMSDGNVANNEPVVVAIHVRCGTLARDATNHATTTPSELVSDGGYHDFCFGWSDTAGGEQWCPSGHVMVGVAGNEAGSSLYNTVSIACVPVVGAVGEHVVFATTGGFANQPELVACPPGQAVASFGVHAGCAQDELVVRCAPITCE